MLDDLPPHAAQPLAAALGRRGGLVLFQHNLPSRGPADVLLRDAATGARTAQLSQIDAELLGDTADERRRLDASLC